MRILLVNGRGADSRFGGAERTVELLRDGLAAHGWRTRVLAACPPIRDTSTDRVSRRATDPRRDPVRRVADRVDGWVAGLPADLSAALAGVDLVHTHNLPGIGTGLWELARRHGVPVVHTVHDYGLLCARSSLCRRDGSPCHPHPLLCGLRRRRLARWAPAVDVVVGVSAHVLRRHAGFFPPQTRTAVIAPPRTPTQAGRPAPALRRLGYVGALTPEKGVDRLLAALPGLARQGVSVGVAGSGPLERRVRDAPVRFAGRLDRTELERFLTDHDAGLVCSAWEEPAVPFTAQEWLAAGRPLLCTDRGALHELADHPGVLGYSGSPTALVEAVRSAADPDRWARLTAGVADAGAEATGPDRFIEAHLAAYAQALEAAP